MRLELESNSDWLKLWNEKRTSSENVVHQKWNEWNGIKIVK